MFKKSSKRFIISDSGLNSQGFRMLTSGGDLNSFKKNPLLLWNHQRPQGNRTDQVLPLGIWEDLRVDGDEISAVPSFDEKDVFAMKIYDKVEAGIIKMCSAGAKILQTSNDPKLTLPGQTKETATLWQLMEGSLTDIGSNPGSTTVALYDKDENIVNLSESTIQTLNPDMPTKEELEAQAAAKKAKEVKLAAENTAEMAKLKEENEALKARLDASEKATEDAKIASLVDTAYGDKRITEKQKVQYAKLAAVDFESTEALIKSLPKDVTLSDRFSEDTPANKAVGEKIAKLSVMTGSELYATPGSFAYLKDNAPEVYKLKYKEKFGVEPKEL